jgi:hypothetical protein
MAIVTGRAPLCRRDVCQVEADVAAYRPAGASQALHIARSAPHRATVTIEALFKDIRFVMPLPFSGR